MGVDFVRQGYMQLNGYSVIGACVCLCVCACVCVCVCVCVGEGGIEYMRRRVTTGGCFL